MDRVVSSRDARDALILKVLLEGKDLQTAQREVEAEERAARGEGTPSKADAKTGPPPARSPEGWTLQVDQVEVQVVEARLETPDMVLTYSAIQASATRVTVQGSRTPMAQAPVKDPLLVDLDGNGPTTTGAQGARPFDLAGNGQVRPTSFVAGGDAFLALDRNGDGRINSGLELFGDQYGAANGFEELAKFDSNGDRQIDGADPVFSQLQLVFTQGGTMRVSDAGLQVLPLQYDHQARTLTSGDQVLAQATGTGKDGAVGLYALGLQTFEAQA